MATKIEHILLIGCEGFIGTSLKEILLNYNYGVIHHDIRDEVNAHDIFSEFLERDINNADIVIHLAAETSVEGSFKNPAQHYITNTMGTARVAYLCQKYHKKLIFPSTGAWYFPELSPYAKSKYLAEEIVKGIMDKTPVTILRLFNVFGPNMNPNSGSIMYNFLTDKEIVVYGSGEQTRDFIHVRDVCEIIKAAISPKWNSKIVEVGMGQEYTINYVAELFAHFRKKKIVYHEATKREIKWSIANTQMLKTLYKKKLTTDLEKDIEELVNATI